MIYVLGAMLAAILALGGLTKCQHTEIVKLEAEKLAIVAESSRLTEQRKAENKVAIEGYIRYAKENTDDYEKIIARYRAAAKSGSVFHPNEGCPTGGQSAAGGAGSPEATASGQGTVPTPRSVALGQPEVATVLGWYAYAESCHKFVVPTVREQVNALRKGSP